MTRKISRSAALICFASFFVVSVSYAQTLPTVTAAEMPLYPLLPRLARIAGTVTLRVDTDGAKVGGVTVQSGPRMLATAAQENVKTWRFAPHEPTSFAVSFNFQLTTDCDPKNDNGKVVLNLPTEVTVSVPLRASECDPNWGLDLSEPLRVFLTSCEVDGVPLSCEKVSLELYSGDLRARPEIANDKSGKKVFIVPKEFRSLSSFSVTVQTPKGSFSLGNLDAGFLKGKWRIVVDHKPFQEENRHIVKGASCIGFVHFQWSEPESEVSAACN